jgi:cob(I)alamin adenosyltransferase
LGETGLFAGPRVGKDMPRIEICGAIDELNAGLGLARAEPLAAEIDGLLKRVQTELFAIGAELATPDPAAQGVRWIGPEHVKALEADIDRYGEALPPLEQFILPGGTRPAAMLHLARTVCRRAERRLVTLIRRSEEPISLVLMAYLNRLSDLLFVLARCENAKAGRPDAVWRKPSREEPRRDEKEAEREEGRGERGDA